MSQGVFLETDVFTSKAFRSIKTEKTIFVLLEFLRRRRIHKQKDRRGKFSSLIITNNGQIELPYRYVMKEMGIKQTTYSRCLDELVSLGFIEIAEMACGLQRIPTKFRISGRWKKYGQPDFVEIRRDRIKPPFALKKKFQLPPLVSEDFETVTADGQ